MDIDSSSAKSPREHEGPAKMRKRVSKACTNCRLKKDKCSGERPRCSACVNNGQACSYDPSSKKRGLPEGYVRGLEKLFAVSMGKIENFEHLISETIMSGCEDKLLEIWNHEQIGEDLHSIWKESRILHQLEILLAKLESAESSPTLKRKHEQSSIKDNAEDDFHRRPGYRVERLAENPNANVDSSLSNKKQKTASASITQSKIHSKPPLPHNSSTLLDNYFAFTHCWFPIIERHHVLRTSYSYSKTNTPSNISAGDEAALWAILAYTTEDGSLRAEIGADDDGSLRDRGEASPLQAYARSLIPDEDGPFAIGHVQAILLLVLMEIGSGKWASAWILVGHAVRVAIQLGLGRESSERKGISVLRGCFMLDTLIAHHLTKCPHLRLEDMEGIVYLEEDGDEEWNSWIRPGGMIMQRQPAFVHSCANRLHDIMLILNDVTCQSTRGMDRGDHSRNHLGALRALPNKFPFQASSLSQAPPHHVYLRLFHFSTTIAVLRQPFEGGAPSDPLANLACEILILLTQFNQNPAAGFTVTPPILEHAVRTACYAAIAARPSFDQISGLPSYNAFARKMTDHIKSLSNIWPLFSSLTTLWQNELQGGPNSSYIPSLSSVENPISNPRNLSHSQSILAPPTSILPQLPPLATSSPTMTRSSMHEAYQSQGFVKNSTPTSGTETSVFQSWDEPETGHSVRGPQNTTQVNRWPNSTASTHGLDRSRPITERNSTFDIPLSDMEQTSPMATDLPGALTMPVSDPSPSFYGDDVDVIFHNLAHLDTTDWTSGREQGLKDSGFADEMTFQAFCNDPERLVPQRTPLGRPSDNIDDFWPPPGFFPGHFEELDPQLEASQILQSLSGNEPFPVMPGDSGW